MHINSYIFLSVLHLPYETGKSVFHHLLEGILETDTQGFTVKNNVELNILVWLLLRLNF
jgi:hypothetical protein